MQFIFAVHLKVVGLGQLQTTVEFYALSRLLSGSKNPIYNLASATSFCEYTHGRTSFGDWLLSVKKRHSVGKRCLRC